ncbi:hypothetical protein [Spiroplasma endosymbiont of Panorpa germanica]|uniref:hypothetical protein n=1 Tax=Spiroplasma endosymbiont of Panorpa germanica TaxID=3066314 RepID=UPI0030D622FF
MKNKEKAIINIISDYFRKHSKEFSSNEKMGLIGVQKDVTKHYFMLHKAAYFIELSHFLITGEKMLSLEFKSFDNGSYASSINSNQQNIDSLVSGDMSLFTEKELDVINKTLKYLVQLSIEEVIELNHIDAGWRYFYQNDDFDSSVINFEKVREHYKNSPLASNYISLIGFDPKESAVLR